MVDRKKSYDIHRKVMEVKRLKVLFASAECAPFAKVGGLADVVASLPKALGKIGVDARIIIPCYGSIDKKGTSLKKVVVKFLIVSGNSEYYINVWEGVLPDSRIPVYFIDSPRHFKSRKIYGAEVPDNERFLFFSLCVVNVLPILGFRPDVVHCHDSHTALIPDLLNLRGVEAFYSKIKTLYTIHNLNYQGISSPSVLKTGNLSTDSLAILRADAQDNDINYMVQGILGADRVSTVSRTYANEISTSIYGAKLERIIRMRSRDLAGILNGIDTAEYDPAKDPTLYKNYDKNSLNAKSANKRYLQKILDLPIDSKVPLIAMVTRLAWQKGLDLIGARLFSLPCQLVVLGRGEKRYEDCLAALARANKTRMRLVRNNDSRLAKLIYAGADMLLVPSRYEPCGLTQMYAMRYGTIPVVRSIGGLKETVNGSTGFRFSLFSENAMLGAVAKAINVYGRDPERWRKMQGRGMSKDFSWKKSARAYLSLYKKMVRN